MSRFYRILEESSRFRFLICLSVMLAVVGTSHARLLDPKDADHWPHVMRSATVPTATMGTTFLNADDIGNHTYTPDGTEKTGIIYTCRGGHIDVAHLRKAADWTANIASKAYDSVKRGYVQFSYKLYEPSVYQVILAYPDDWATTPREERDRIAFEVATALAQHCAYTALTWHEVLTWFGYKTLYVLSEFESSFSWEDMFSNLLGTHLAVQALRDPDRSFDDAMTKLLDEEIAMLGGQSARTARRASTDVRGLWWSYNMIFLSMKKRNMDIGLDDGYVTPWLVPDVPQCPDAQPVSYPIPSLDLLDKYGFKMKLVIEMHEWEAPKILNVVYPDGRKGRNTVVPAVHMPIIMDGIRQRAIKRWGPYFDNPRIKNTKSVQEVSSRLTGPGYLKYIYSFGLEDILPITDWWLQQPQDLDALK